MENSLDKVEAYQSFQSPPRRRRSTFFERRDSVAPQTTHNDDTDTHTDTAVSKKNTEYDKRINDMTRYYEMLMAEKELWKTEVKERRNTCNDLRQQLEMSKNAPSTSRMSYAALTNEDIEFLKAKPNISKLIDAQQKLHNSVKQTMALVRRANELDEVVLEYCEKKLNKLTEQILENSTVDNLE